MGLTRWTVDRPQPSHASRLPVTAGTHTHRVGNGDACRTHLSFFLVRPDAPARKNLPLSSRGGLTLIPARVWLRFEPRQQQVKSEAVAVSHLQSGGFVGSMAFNRFIKAPPSGINADGGYIYREGGMFRKAWEVFLHLLRREGSVVGEVAKSVVGDKKRKWQDKSEMERSNNTITATSDVSASLHSARSQAQNTALFVGVERLIIVCRHRWHS